MRTVIEAHKSKVQFQKGDSLDDKRPIGGIIQLDNVYWDGERLGSKRGRGAAGKTPFVAAVALDKEEHPIKMQMTVFDGFKTNSIGDWAKTTSCQRECADILWVGLLQSAQAGQF